jgi:hypothetical protein
MKIEDKRKALEIELEENYLNYINQYPKDKDVWTMSYILSMAAIESFLLKEELKEKK